MLAIFINTWIKFLFLFAPFFAVSMVLALTPHSSNRQRRNIINRAILACCVITALLFFAGNPIFELMGITIYSFRIGAGALLFVTAVNLVSRDDRHPPSELPERDRDDPAVVPLAVPVIIGPATIGAILVYGADLSSGLELAAGVGGVLLALASLWVILLLSTNIENLLGASGLNVMSKITGLILSAMAAQMIMTGVQYFFPRAG